MEVEEVVANNEQTNTNPEAKKPVKTIKFNFNFGKLAIWCCGLAMGLFLLLAILSQCGVRVLYGSGFFPCLFMIMESLLVGGALFFGYLVDRKKVSFELILAMFVTVVYIAFYIGI